MITNILEYLKGAHLPLIFEENTKAFPLNGKQAKLSWWKGDHCKVRQKERKVSDKEITDAIFAAYNDIKKLYNEGTLKLSKTGKDSYVIIVDARHDRSNPLCICLYVFKNWHPRKLEHPSFTVKTVFKKSEENQPDFSGLMRNGKKRENEYLIFLY